MTAIDWKMVWKTMAKWSGRNERFREIDFPGKYRKKVQSLVEAQLKEKNSKSLKDMQLEALGKVRINNPLTGIGGKDGGA